MSRRDDDRRFHDYARYTLSAFREPIAPVETTDEIRRAREAREGEQLQVRGEEQKFPRCSVNARLMPGPGDAPLPTIDRSLANALRDECDAIETAAEEIGNARASIPSVSDLRLDSRRRELVDQIMRLESALFELATDVRDSVED